MNNGQAVDDNKTPIHIRSPGSQTTSSTAITRNHKILVNNCQLLCFLVPLPQASNSEPAGESQVYFPKRLYRMPYFCPVPATSH